MNIKELHAKFKDEHSPSVEGQVRWLQKQGFTPDQIDQAILEFYTDLSLGKEPQVFERIDNGQLIDRQFVPYNAKLPPFHYSRRKPQDGLEYDRVLLEYAKRKRTEELTQRIDQLQKFEKMLRKKWKSQVPWYKRIIGKKPVIEEEE